MLIHILSYSKEGVAWDVGVATYFELLLRSEFKLALGADSIMVRIVVVELTPLTDHNR